MIAVVCYIIALVLFALATFNVPGPVNLIAAGLFFLALGLVATAGLP